jgi:hypothetical protein
MHMHVSTYACTYAYRVRQFGLRHAVRRCPFVVFLKSHEETHAVGYAFERMLGVQVGLFLCVDDFFILFVCVYVCE